MLAHNGPLAPTTFLRRLGRCALALMLSGGVACAAHAQSGNQLIDVTTYAYDNLRSGLNPNETLLTPANVNPNSFGRLFTLPVDGQVYAQPLYLHGLTIPGLGVHNVVFIATEHDSVYAFDADAGNTPLWQVSFLDPANGVTSCPFTEEYGYMDINPEVGITSTPVIDSGSRTLYVVAKTQEMVLGVPTYMQRLHALDVTTGAERPNSPVVIQATVPGTGDGSDGKGNVPFNPLIQHNRSALLLLNGVVYIAYASHDDLGPYHGWLFAYDATTLQQVGVLNSTPNALSDPSGWPIAAGGVWMSGAGPAADSAGNIYLATGNGTLDVDPTDPQYPAFGDSVVRLSTANGLAFGDYFSPFNQWNLNATDGDLGSGGVMLLPDSVQLNGVGPLLIACGKEGRIYVLGRDNLGQYNGNYDLIPQALPPGTLTHGVWGRPAYYNQTIYYGGYADPLRAFAFQTFQARDFFPYAGVGDISNVTFNGSAKFTTNGANLPVLRLMDGNPREAGSGFVNYRVNVSAFTASFQFQFNADPNAEDGITFVLQGTSPSFVGGYGPALGYAGLGNSIAIKYDLVQHFDPDTGASLGKSSTGLFINGATPTVSYDPNYPTYDLTQSGIDLHSGHVFSANLTYNGTTLTVTTTDTVTQATAVQSYTINIPAIIGSKLGYGGFTGSTDNDTDTDTGTTADILNINYQAPGQTAQLLVPVSTSVEKFNYPGGLPIISASTVNGQQTNGIVWVLDNSGFQTGVSGQQPRPAILNAFLATDLTRSLYSSHTRNEDAGIAVKFTAPVVANGKVYVGGQNQVTVYGKRP